MSARLICLPLVRLEGSLESQEHGLAARFPSPVAEEDDVADLISLVLFHAWFVLLAVDYQSVSQISVSRGGSGSYRIAAFRGTAVWRDRARPTRHASALDRSPRPCRARSDGSQAPRLPRPHLMRTQQWIAGPPPAPSRNAHPTKSARIFLRSYCKSACLVLRSPPLRRWRYLRLANSFAGRGVRSRRTASPRPAPPDRPA
jgi:hypothetical protein